MIGDGAGVNLLAVETGEPGAAPERAHQGEVLDVPGGGPAVAAAMVPVRGWEVVGLG